MDIENEKWYRDAVSNGYQHYLNTDGMQLLIDKIVKWYELKISNSSIKKNMMYSSNGNIININYYFLWDKLLKRLNVNQRKTVNCFYRSDDVVKFVGDSDPFEYTSKKDEEPDNICLLLNVWKPNAKPYTIFLTFDKNGQLTYAMDAYFDRYIKNGNIINTVEELYRTLIESKIKNIDYSSLKNCIEEHNIDLKVRNYLFNSSINKLINAEDQGNNYGIFRAKRFVENIYRSYKDVEIDSGYSNALKMSK